MIRQLVFRVACYILSLATICQATSAQSTRGTINILLANKNGMVLVTDSRATSSDGRHFDNSSKLFQIDDRMVCSIAGFATDPGPIREMRLEAAGVIRGFRESLASFDGEADLSFEEKLKDLAFEIEYRMTVLRDSKTEYGQSSNVGSFQLLAAGYEPNGTAKIAKIGIDVNPGNQGKEKLDWEIKPIEGELSYFTAGIDDSVRARLSNPGAFSDEMPIKNYGLAKDHNLTSELTLKQLDDLAVYLEMDAAKTYASIVSGDIQKAVLADGRVEFSPPKGLNPGEKPPPIMTFTDHLGLKGMGATIPMHLEKPVALTNFSCSNSGLELDGAMVYSGKLDRCYFFYAGGEYYLSPTLDMSSSVLVLDDNLDINNPKVQEIRRDFPALKIGRLRSHAAP